MTDQGISLTAEQRTSAVALFEAGYSWRAVAKQLDLHAHGVRALRDRWRIRGQEVLMAPSPQRVYSFELKRAVVLRFLAGETKIALAKEFDLSSPALIKGWVRIYRAEGEAGLQPKGRGRPPRELVDPEREESELERLRRENEYLRAEVAYLGKLKALMSRERR